MTRVLFKPATRRDGEVAASALGRAGIELLVFDDFAALVQAMHDTVGALLLTDLAFTEPGFGTVLTALEQQPAWSDLAVILLVRAESPALRAVVARLTNVTLLDRPSSVRTLTSALQAALRARQRQYQMRDQLVQLEQAHGALRDADSRKDAFIATLAHELRNPLAPIRAAAHLLGRPGVTQQQLAKSAAMIARQTRNMALLLDDLLDVARVTQGKLALRLAEATVGGIVNAALEAAQPLLDARAHRLDVRVETPAHSFTCDALRVSQVLTNVLTNAAKYTEPGGHIQLDAGVADGLVSFAVRDNGIGIAAAMLPQVFDMFVQADGAHGRSGGGLGIGLALARSLVDMHGGQLTAESDGPGRGALFRIQLPAQVAADPAAAASAGADDHAADQPTGQRVLVVDDNRDAAEALAMLLQMQGYDAVDLFSGALALQEAARRPPAAMLVDIGMPDMNGYTVARHVRGAPWGSGVLLVACTGWGQPDDKRKALDAGFDAHLTKPVNPVELEQLLDRRLAH